MGLVVGGAKTPRAIAMRARIRSACRLGFIMAHRDVDASSQRARLIILSTGGTIAMTTKTAQGGAAMTFCATNLIAAVPRLADLAEIEGHDMLAKPSADFTFADIAAIEDAATAAAKRDLWSRFILLRPFQALWRNIAISRRSSHRRRAGTIFSRACLRESKEKYQLLRAHSHVFPAARPRNAKSMTQPASSAT